MRQQSHVPNVAIGAVIFMVIRVIISMRGAKDVVFIIVIVVSVAPKRMRRKEEAEVLVNVDIGLTSAIRLELSKILQ